MLLQKNLKKLAGELGDKLSSLRLWGKIIGTEKDYFIAEGVVGGGDEEAVEGADPRGSGINKYVYWASNGPTDEWKELPDCRPDDIKNAR